MAINYPQRWLREAQAVTSKEGWRKSTTRELLKCQKGLDIDDGGNDDANLAIVKKYIRGINLSSDSPIEGYNRKKIVNNNISANIFIFTDVIDYDALDNAPENEQVIINNYISNYKVTVSDSNFNVVRSPDNFGYLLEGKNLTNDKYTFNIVAKLEGFEDSTIEYTCYTTPELIILDSSSSSAYVPEGQLFSNSSFGVYGNIYDPEYVPTTAELFIEYENPSQNGTISIITQPDLASNLVATISVNRFDPANDIAYFYFVIDGVQMPKKVLDIKTG